MQSNPRAPARAEMLFWSLSQKEATAGHSTWPPSLATGCCSRTGENHPKGSELCRLCISKSSPCGLRNLFRIAIEICLKDDQAAVRCPMPSSVVRRPMGAARGTHTRGGSRLDRQRGEVDEGGPCSVASRTPSQPKPEPSERLRMP